MTAEPTGSPAILSLGTQVVSLEAVPATDGRPGHPAGAVGVVIKAPVDATHSHVVRFADGSEIPLKRSRIEIRKHLQRAGLADPLHRHDLYDHVIYRCVVGSRAYGLDREDSDVDRRGVYLPPAAMHWSIYGVPGQLENHETDECYWEIQKFLSLALKANPNILECLNTPLVETVTPLAEEMLGLRDAFLSRLVYQTYGGYVMSQMGKLEQDLRSRGEIRWKHAMHLVRLLLSGITVLREGLVPVRVEAHRSRLLAIRDGDIPWEDVERWRLELQGRFDAAYAETSLPEQPDYSRVNAFLVRARRSVVEKRGS